MVGEAAEFAVDLGHEAIERVTVAVAPGDEQTGEVFRGSLWHVGSSNARSESERTAILHPGRTGRQQPRMSH
jgi:hypothetical protein